MTTTTVSILSLALATLGVFGALANLVLAARGPWCPLWLPPLVAVAGMVIAIGAALAARRNARRRWRAVDAELARIRAVKLEIIAGGRGRGQA